MLKKIAREIILFLISTGLVIYVFFYCLYSCLIDLFIGTKVRKSFVLAQEKLEKFIGNIGMKILKKLGEKGIWY